MLFSDGWWLVGIGGWVIMNTNRWMVGDRGWVIMNTECWVVDDKEYWGTGREEY